MRTYLIEMPSGAFQMASYLATGRTYGKWTRPVKSMPPTIVARATIFFPAIPHLAADDRNCDRDRGRAWRDSCEPCNGSRVHGVRDVCHTLDARIPGYTIYADISRPWHSTTLLADRGRYAICRCRYGGPWEPGCFSVHHVNDYSAHPP